MSNHGLRSEKLRSSGLRTGVRLPSAPLPKKRPTIAVSGVFLLSFHPLFHPTLFLIVQNSAKHAVNDRRRTMSLALNFMTVSPPPTSGLLAELLSVLHDGIWSGRLFLTKMTSGICDNPAGRVNDAKLYQAVFQF